jgi:hypothetical protein
MPADPTIEQVRAAFPDWNIEFEYGYWTAVHTDFEASWEGEEDEYVGNGLSTSGRTPADLAAELECLIEEHPHFNKSETGKPDHEQNS